MPSRDTPHGTSTSDYHATFEREQRVLAQLSHGNIVRLYEFGTDLEYEGKSWAYHVTEWVEGEKLQDEMKSALTTPEQCYALVSQVLRAVRYMHELGIAHGDIKQENIRCRRLSDKTRQAVLLDFGSAHLFGETAANSPAILQHRSRKSDKDSVVEPDQAVDHSPFATTYKLIHPELMQYRNQPVTAENRDVIYPFHDVYSLGILLRDLLGVSEIKAKFENTLGSNGMRALQLIQKRILDSLPSDPYYTSESLYRDWEKLSPDYLAPAGVPELSLAAEFKYAIATPLGRVVITPRLNFLASHKLFLRIGGIPQLELLRLKFAGATHSRLEHSALVLRNARYYLSHLLNGPVFRLLISHHDLEATLILALLHDIGHYQLSHMFEDYASEQKRLKGATDSWQELSGPAAAWKNLKFDIPSDDDLFVAAFDYLSVENISGDYGKVIQRACENNAHKLKLPSQPTLGWVTRRHFSNETYEAVVALHESVYRRKPASLASHIVLGGILSSGLDADKVSYLMQDATETGVRFGLGIDIDGLLGSLRSPSPQDIAVATGPLLAINSKGVAAAESVLMARNFMYERVYWHPTNRAIIAMIKYCITRLLRSGALDFPSFLEDTFFESHDYALKHLYHLYHEKFRPSTTIPIAYVIDGERSIHREYLSYSIENETTGRAVAEKLLRMTIFDVADLEDKLFEEAKQQFPRLTIIPGDVLLDVPAKDRSRPSGERGGSVLVYKGNSYTKGRRLDRVTPMAGDVIQTHDTRSKVCRVFISRRLSAQLEGRSGTEFVSFVRGAIAKYVGASDATAVIS